MGTHILAHEHSQHNPLLVVLSYIIATISAYASIELARRMKHAEKKTRLIWLFSGASALGVGIWSMHFIAMLAYQFPVPVYYDTALVVISVIIAAVGCILGFYIISSHEFSVTRFLSSGIIMGIGIAAMHYVGMAAIRAVDVTYNKTLFSISIFIAVIASMVALWIGFISPYSKRDISWKLKLVFSLLMAIAITGMHYSGMAAAVFSINPATKDAIPSNMIDSNLLAWAVSAATFMIFFILFFSITFDRMWRRRKIVQSTLLDSATDGIVVTNHSGVILHANPAFYHVIGWNSGMQHPLKIQDYHDGFTKVVPFSKDLQLKVGSRTIEVKRHPIKGESLDHSLWFIKDITERILAKKNIEFMAYHDTLTKLPNRHKLEIELNKWINEGTAVTCIFLDLDRLKFTNDTLGHQAGDVLIKLVSERLLKIISTGDLIARIGGDEFIILLPGDRSKYGNEVAAQCVEEMKTPFNINGVNVRVTISAGICSYPNEASSATELIRFADLAMYESKRNGKNQVKTFNSTIMEQIRRNVQLEESLLTAIDHHEFYLLYQPKINVHSGELIGVEALIRWNHPMLGQISPMEFIPIAEEKGMIFEIGDWVLREACTQWVKWHEESLKPVMMAVNISPLQFSNEDFLPKVKAIISETKMNPQFLELEITESASLALEDQTKIKLHDLKEMGINISLDDFGTGYSSFKNLKELPIQVLKIDKSFLEQLIGNKGQEAIVRSMIQLGHNLNLKVLVEGVENQMQEQWLKNEGCDIVQGFFYSRPVHEGNIKEMLGS